MAETSGAQAPFETTEQILETAELHHQAGNLSQAEELYRQVLAADPAHAHAYNMLGLMALQLDQPAFARDLIAAAAELEPDNGLYHRNLGTAYYALEQLDDAEAAFRHATELAPEDAEAWLLLGTTLKRAERYGPAAEALEQAVTLNPNDVRAHTRLAQAFISLHRYEDAETLARAATGLAPNDTEALATLADALLLLARPEEVLPLAKRLVKLEPANASHYQVLSQAFVDAGVARRAEEPARQAIRLDPDNGRAYGTLAVALKAQRRWAEALDAVEQAIALCPEAEDLLAFKARLFEHQGRYKEAFALVQPLVSGRTRFEAVALDVFLALARRLDYREKALELLESVLHNMNVADTARMPLLFTAGTLYEDLERYDEAFTAYKNANDLKPHGYPRAETEAFHTRLMNHYTSEFFDSAPRADHGSDRPIFIVGMPRSGTSLTEQILACHPDVFGAGELNKLSSINASMPGIIGEGDRSPECLSALSVEAANEAAQRYLDYIDELAPAEARRITDKLPLNFQHLGLIALLFPEARIIHCSRDPMDTCLSCYVQNFNSRGLGFTYDLGSLGHFYRQYTRLMDHWRDVLPLPIHEVQYERLVDDTEGEVARLLEFCGLEWNDACLRPHESKRMALTASYDQVRQPIYKGSVGRWRKYEKHLQPLKEALGYTE